MADPSHRHGYDRDSLMDWRKALPARPGSDLVSSPPANGWAEVESLRDVVRAMHERIVRGGPRNYDDDWALDRYFPDSNVKAAYLRAMGRA